MSRGLGRTQQFIQSQLAGGYWRDIRWLAYRRHEHEPTAAEIESMRRAVRTLTARGVVESRRMNIGAPGDPLEVRLKPGRRKPTSAGSAEPIDPDDLETIEGHIPPGIGFRAKTTHRRSRTSGRTLCGLASTVDGRVAPGWGGRQVSANGKVTCKRCLAALSRLRLDPPRLSGGEA